MMRSIIFVTLIAAATAFAPISQQGSVQKATFVKAASPSYAALTALMMVEEPQSEKAPAPGADGTFYDDEVS